MWMNVEKEQADALLKLQSDDPAVKHFQERIRQYAENSKVDDAFRTAAKEHVSEGALEVDEGAVVSRGEDEGAYVMAWIWITNEEAGFPDDVGSEELEEPTE